MRLLPTTHRNTALRRVLATALPLVTAAAAVAQQAPPNPADQQADAALADRLEGLAALTFPAKVPTGGDRPFVFAEQAALLQAATTLDPTEPRYPRKVAEALAGAGDVDGQYKALARVAYLRPADEFNWTRLLDLHLSQMQSAGEQVKYLGGRYGIETSAAVPPRVRSYAYARHALIAFDQDRKSEARKLVTYALAPTNNPLNLTALQLQYRLLTPASPPLERMRVLLDLLKANPLQPGYAREAALLAADAGEVQDALSFFSLAVNTSSDLGRLDLEGWLDWAAEQYVTGQSVDAYRQVQNLLSVSPNDPSAWYLDLLVVPYSGLPQAQHDKDLQRATVVMSNRVSELVNIAADLNAHGPAARPSSPHATTRPLDAEGGFPLPDVSATAAFLKSSADAPPRLRQDFIDAVADLARLEIYFAKKPAAAAPLMDALRDLLPADDPLLLQLQGLNSLATGDAKAAAVTLAGAAKDDPIAALGLILAQWKDNPNDTQKADTEARKLIQDHPDGLVGAFLFEALTNPRVRLLPKANQMPMEALLQAFPRDLFNLGEKPGSLYSLHAEPVDAGRAWGQPLLALVTLFNVSGTDLTLGDGGMIRSGLVFQMTPLTGNRPPSYPAFDTLAGPLVLHPHESVQQVVRVDQSALIGVLDQNVRLAFQIDGQASTNPDTRLGGYAVHFNQPFARMAVNPKAVAEARARLNGPAVNGSTPADRFVSVGVVEAYVREMRNVRNLEPATVRDVSDLANIVHRASLDDSKPVVAWAKQADFALSDEKTRAAIIQGMVADPDWRQRQLALVLVAAVPDPALQKKVVDQLQADPQPTVAAYAKAAAALLKRGRPMTPPAAPPPAGAAGVPGGAGANAQPPGPSPSQLPVPLY